MKKSRLLEIIREEIAGALREDEAAEKAAKAAAIKATDLEIAALQKKKAELMKSGVSEAEDLNEIRSLLSSWRETRKAIWATTVKMLTTATLLFISGAVWMTLKDRVGQ